MQSICIITLIRAMEVGERRRRENMISLLSAENKSTFAESSGAAKAMLSLKMTFY